MHPRHIHIVGVGGIATSALAAELIRRGHHVTGSDEYILPPASEVLAACGLQVHDGYEASQVADTVDLAVLGAGVTVDNPVVQEVLRRGIRHVSWPRLLRDLGLLTRHNGVVTGTNGKTTTACMWAWILEQAGVPADRMIGGKIAPWATGISLQGAEHGVLEGDEYPSGCSDALPKFAHYQPEIVILLNIHFDHSDVFADEQEVRARFALLGDLLPPGGLLVYNGDDATCREVAATVRCRTLSYGMEKNVQAQVQEFRPAPEGVAFQVRDTDFFLPLWGAMNAQNAAAAALAAECWGVPLEASARALRTFPGALGRQKRLRVDDTFVLLTDTAYHPHAVASLLEALRAHFPTRTVGLVLQPRHTTGAANWQQTQWPQALRQVSRLILMDGLNRPGTGEDLFSGAELCRELQERGVPAHHAPEADRAVALFQELAAPGDVWVLCLENWFTHPHDKIVEWAMQMPSDHRPSLPCASSSPSVN